MIYALVTLYNPSEVVVKNAIKLSQHTDFVYLIDNSEYDNSSMFQLEKAKYFPNNCNLGLAAAFNKILKNESFTDDDYIIFFDQDSCITDSLIKSLIQDFCTAKQYVNIGCIGPAYYETNSQKTITPNTKKYITDNIYSVSTIITSSMLTTYKNIKDIDFWNEKVFLDLSDFDVCWRFNAAGYKVCLSCNTQLTHTLGNKVIKLLFLTLRPGIPVREYYQIRDSIKLSSEKYVPFKYRIRFLIMWFIMPLIYVIVAPEKIKRIKMIGQAFIDGIKGKNGTFVKKAE